MKAEQPFTQKLDTLGTKKKLLDSSPGRKQKEETTLDGCAIAAHYAYPLLKKISQSSGISKH
jgi:hypothetical protein